MNILDNFQENEGSFFVGLVCKRWNILIKRNKKLRLGQVTEYYARLGSLSAINLLNQLTSKTVYELVEYHNKYISYGAAQSGNIELLQWVMSHGCAFNKTTCIKAAEAGQLEVIKWLASKMDYWSKDFGYKAKELVSDVCIAAAGGGHVHVLEWLFKNIRKATIQPEMATKAARNGQLDVLIWMLKLDTTESNYVNVCSAAARGGHLLILLWARMYYFPWSHGTCAEAAGGGHLDIIKWLREQGCPMDDSVLINAGKEGHLHILEWALDIGIIFTREVCRAAASRGQLHVLKWIKENKLPWAAKWLDKYPQNANYLEAMKWAKTLGYVFKEHNYITAAENLEALQWLKDNNCPWSEKFLSKVAKKGNAAALKFGLENNCPWNDRHPLEATDLWDVAGQGGSVEVIKTLVNFEKPTHLAWRQIGIFASGFGKLDALKFMFKNESVCLDELLDNAEQGGEDSVATHQWLLKQF